MLRKEDSVVWTSSSLLSDTHFLSSLDTLSATDCGFTEFKEMVWNGKILSCRPWELGDREGHRQENWTEKDYTVWLHPTHFYPIKSD